MDFKGTLSFSTGVGSEVGGDPGMEPPGLQPLGETPGAELRHLSWKKPASLVTQGGVLEDDAKERWAFDSRNIFALLVTCGFKLGWGTPTPVLARKSH